MCRPRFEPSTCPVRVYSVNATLTRLLLGFIKGLDVSQTWASELLNSVQRISEKHLLLNRFQTPLYPSGNYMYHLFEAVP
jgi:hypothetical protein